MEEDMEDMIEYTFTAVEIDLDYEFDAPKYFDFSSGESFPVRSLSESWFDSAESYPDSRHEFEPWNQPLAEMQAFVTRLISKESGLLENINISPKSKIENMSLSDSDSDIEVEQEVPAVLQEGEGNNAGIAAHVEISNAEKLLNQLRQQLPSGLTFYDHIAKGATRGKTRCLVKPSCPRSSTLMKPTASHLAKQSLPRPTGESRLPTFLVEKNGTISTVIETQAAKRQKLESGHLRKVDEAKPVFSFVHKEPKRDGKVDRNNTLAKTRITIPREPDLQTTHRALRARPKGSEQAENMPPTTIRRFKALPLNRKIFEGPSLPPKRSNPQLPQFQVRIQTGVFASYSCSKITSPIHIIVSGLCYQNLSHMFHEIALITLLVIIFLQTSELKFLPLRFGFQEFHLKTSERAVQHRSAVSTFAANSSSTNDKVLPKASTNSTMECGNREFRRVNHVEAPKQEESVSTYHFKALPLNKKILSSKGDIGVFRNTKKETTVPMLSLASEPQPAGGVQLKAQRPSCHLSKVTRSCPRFLMSGKKILERSSELSVRREKLTKFNQIL
ncbi:putative protein TPX2-like isoform X2 [Capsicum annuum]|nr:putative protein TPX2-like isoform X2 [Capsicum annuum]